MKKLAAILLLFVVCAVALAQPDPVRTVNVHMRDGNTLTGLMKESDIPAGVKLKDEGYWKIIYYADDATGTLKVETKSLGALSIPVKQAERLVICLPDRY